MEINTKVLSEQQVTSTSGTKKMKLSKNASQMVFQLFTKNVYSNPIGTVVREITSNSFDSHVEAGVQNTPVLIKKTHDEETGTHYISFIDYGVGMSPERVENIYGVYFESTKRDNNNEIGGFGIGGKTPMAYKRPTGDGEGDYDNSFFVITNYNGTKYYYTVFEGLESPEFTLFHSEATKEGNGTEIRIPVLQRDIIKFEHEIKRQLFYFEGIVFEGFSDDISNDYQIIRGKKFLYRKNSHDNYMHVCLGKVYYSLNYELLGLKRYDYQIPVAINVPIGAIGMTVAREELDYSEKNIQYIKKAAEAVKDELKSMLTKQYNSVQTLQEYFEYVNYYGSLKLTEDTKLHLGNVIKQNDIILKRFKYNQFLADLKKEMGVAKMPSPSELFKLFFTTKQFGAKQKKSWRHKDSYLEFELGYMGLVNMSRNSHPNIYCSEPTDLEIKRIKQAYLKSEHGRFYIIVPRDLTEMRRKIGDVFSIYFNDDDAMVASPLFNEILGIQEEYMEIVRKYAKDYSSIEVPEDFKVKYSRKRITEDIKNATISVKFDNRQRNRIKVADLAKFKGRIFYGTSEDEYTINRVTVIHRDVFGSQHRVNNAYEFMNDERAGIMFVLIAKNNVKYMKVCRNAHHIDEYYHKMAYRKIDELLQAHRNRDIVNAYDDITKFYKTDMFELVSKSWFDKVQTIKDYVSKISSKCDVLYYYNSFFSKYIDIPNKNDIVLTEDEIEIRKTIDDVNDLQELNNETLEYINTPNNGWSIINQDTDNKILPDLLKKVLVL